MGSCRGLSGGLVVWLLEGRRPAVGSQAPGVVAVSLLAALFQSCGGSTTHSGNPGTGATSTDAGLGGEAGAGPAAGGNGGISSGTRGGTAATGSGGTDAGATVTSSASTSSSTFGAVSTASTGGGMAGSGGNSAVSCGGVICNDLPNVAPGAAVSCVDDQCVVPPEGCASGFGHCSDDANDGCETYLGRATACGACDNVCPSALPVCTLSSGAFSCASACVDQTPDFCNGCVNTKTDLRHCGACDVVCQSDYNQVQCSLGQCMHGECFPGTARCSDSLKCEPLNTPENCGACGRSDCGAEHATADCTRPDTCGAPVCESGYANCDQSSPDCETEFGGGCTPRYVGTLQLDVADPPLVAWGPDGVIWLAGFFSGEADLDPTASSDIHLSGDGGAIYFSKLNADGSYGFSRTFPGGSVLHVASIAPGPSGSLLIAGTFPGVVDFDAGAGVVELGSATANEQAYVALYNADGEFGWARAWSNGTEAFDVASDGIGQVYCGGSYAAVGGTRDIDPGPGIDLREPQHAVSGFLVRLDDAGNYEWGDVSGGGFEDLAVSPSTGVWAVGPFFDMGVWTYPSGVRQIYWPEFRSTLVRLRDGVVTLAGAVGADINVGPPNFPEPRTIVQGQTAAALLRLQEDGSYLGLSLLQGEVFAGLASAPDGGSVALTTTGSVLGYDFEGSPVYRFQSAAGSDTTALVEGPRGFLLVGRLSSPMDMDPGPGNAPIAVGSFISEFAF